MHITNNLLVGWSVVIMDPEVVQAEVVNVQVAYVDKKLLDRTEEITKAKIDYEKKKLDELADHQKKLMKEAQDHIDRLNQERIAAETRRIQDEADRIHMQWRKANPILAAEEDRMKQEEHQRELERMKMHQEASEKAAVTTAKVAAGAVIGGVVAFFM